MKIDSKIRVQYNAGKKTKIDSKILIEYEETKKNTKIHYALKTRGDDSNLIKSK